MDGGNIYMTDMTLETNLTLIHRKHGEFPTHLTVDLSSEALFVLYEGGIDKIGYNGHFR